MSDEAVKLAREIVDGYELDADDYKLIARAVIALSEERTLNLGEIAALRMSLREALATMERWVDCVEKAGTVGHLNATKRIAELRRLLP